MKAVFFEGNRKISIKDIPVPVIREGEVLVKIQSAALCGSDMKHFFADQASSVIEGHENAGIIVESRSSKWKEGDKVISYAIKSCGICRDCLAGDRIFCTKLDYILGGFSEYIAVPEENCLQLPDFMDFKGGSVFGDCIGLSFHTLKRLPAEKNDKLVIMGVGPVGLGMVLMAKLMELEVIAVDVNPSRLKLAEDLGADFRINSLESDWESLILKITGDRGPDITIDCAGKEFTQLACMKLCRKAGSVAFVAGNTSLSFNPNDFFLTKELHVLGSWYFNFNNFDKIVELIKDKIEVSKLVTDSFKFTEAQEAFDLFASGNCAKVVLTP
jgi:threonine dehydrogenase-like Zn-dependent dehydrogenase